MPSATSIDWYSSLEEDPCRTHSRASESPGGRVSMHRETLENLGSSPFAKKHVRIVLATEAREGFDTQDKAERSAWSSALYRTVDQIVDAFPSLRRNRLKILAALVRQRNTCTRTCLLSFGRETHEHCVDHLWPARAWVITLKTEPSITRWQLATTSRT